MGDGVLPLPDMDGVDLAPQLDVAYSPDWARPDVTQPDLAQPDLSSPDTAQPDIAQPDLSSPDMPSLDIIKPDTMPQPSWSRPRRLDTMTDDEKDLQLAAGPAGDVHAAWIELGFISTEVEVVSYPWP